MFCSSFPLSSSLLFMHELSGLICHTTMLSQPFSLVSDSKPQSTHQPFIKADITNIQHNQCQYRHPTSHSTIYIHLPSFRERLLKRHIPRKENGYTHIVSQSSNKWAYLHLSTRKHLNTILRLLPPRHGRIQKAYNINNNNKITEYNKSTYSVHPL
jgi:hypothetical protein